MGGAERGVRAARLLRDLDCCTIGPGLTDAELDAAETRYGFAFAEDHRAFLAEGLPLHDRDSQGWGFPDWRDLDADLWPCNSRGPSTAS